MKLAKIKIHLEHFLLSVAKNIFLCSLLFLLLSLLLGGFIFYKYIILPQKTILNIKEEPLLIKKAIHQEIVKRWQIKENESREVDLKEYSNLFDKQPVLPPVEELTE